MTTIEKMRRFLTRWPEAVCNGFFWCGPGRDYRVVILAKHGTRHEGIELHASTAVALVRVAKKAGFSLGTPQRVAKLCEDAPRSPRIRRNQSQARRPRKGG